MGLLRHVEGLEKLDWGIDFARKGLLNGRPIIMAANGPGPNLAASTAKAIKERYELDGMASIGFCGALNPSLQPCQILVALSIMNQTAFEKGSSHGEFAYDVRVPPRSRACQRQLVILLSHDHVATTPKEKSELHNLCHADAIEMEAAGLAPLAQDWQIPFYAIKVVTDTATESFPLDFNRLRTPEGRFSYPKIIGAALRHPRAIPALINLNRRCTQAAAILGDFLANASF